MGFSAYRRAVILLECYLVGGADAGATAPDPHPGEGSLSPVTC